MRKKLLVLAMVLVTSIGVMGCSEDLRTSDEKVKDKQEQLSKEANKKVGMPEIKNFFEKEIHKEILELRDDPNLINYAYIQNMDGRFTYIGQCIGYPLPYSTQYTNPEYQVANYNDSATLPQQDPNGLFSSGNASATWIILLNEDGDRQIGYFENELVVTQSKLPKNLLTQWSVTDNY